jgi:DNA polymerase III subunit beta
MTATIERPSAADPKTTTPLACTVAQAALKTALATVTRAIGGRTTLPILHNVRVTADAETGTLGLAATDLEIAFDERVPALIESSGVFTVPAKLFSDLVSTLPADTVRLWRESVASPVLHVACGRAKAQLKGVDAFEFPPLPQTTGVATATLPADAFLLALRLSAFIATGSVPGQRTANVALQRAEGELYAQAADGYRATDYRRTEDRYGGEPFKILLPAKAAKESERLLDELTEGTEADVEAALWLLPSAQDPNWLVLRVDGTEGGREVLLASRLSVGEFYPLERLIPKAPTTVVTAPRAALTAAVRRAHLFARASADVMDLVIAGGTDGPSVMSVQANSAEHGEGDSEFEVEVSGEDATSIVNGAYLRELLDVLPGESVRFSFAGPTLPIVIEDPTVPGFRHVVMPMQRLNQRQPDAPPARSESEGDAE